MPHCRIICPLLFIIISLYGCATRTEMLPAREQVGETSTPVMVALESYRGDAKFFIKYRFGEQILYSGGDWQDRLELSAEPASANYVSPSMLPMQFRQQQPELAVQTINLAHAFDARVILANPTAVGKTGLALIASACVDFRESLSHRDCPAEA